MTEATMPVDLSMDNPSAALAQMEASQKMTEIDSALAARRGEAPASTANPNMAKASNGNSNANTSGEKPAGRDQVLQFLEANADHMPGGVEAFKDMQRTISQQGQSNSALETRLGNLENALTENQPEQVDPDTERRRALVNRIPVQQQEAFQALLDEMGYVSRQELAANEADREAYDYTVDTINQGVEAWGEEFGQMEGEQFVWNPEIRDGVRELYQEMLSEDKGITPTQLYKLYKHDQLVEDAYNRGAQEGGGVNRIAHAANARTINQSTHRAPDNQSIYRQGDSLDTVTERAVLKAFRAMGQ
tara:strand:- start:1333 stop:2244 length:912 start_codon:yes stop_codon:yes gene_type:complete